MDWPQKNEQLFKSDGTYVNLACLRYHWSSLEQFGLNYKDAADVIIDAAIAGAKSVDNLIYPAVFLYRHYLELTLKDIILRLRYIVEGGDGYPRTHNMNKLWPEAKRLIKKNFNSEAPIELKILDSCFKEFNEHDRNSVAFRYPNDKSESQNLNAISHINVQNFKETMQRISNLLSCIAAETCNQYQWVLEREAEMDSAFEADNRDYELFLNGFDGELF